MTYNYLLCGVGGQGTVLASKLLAQCAIERGLMARTAETIGMAQRGGCVVSHVRVGNEVHSPLIPLGCADVIIGFEPGEAVRCLPYLKKGGVVIAAQKTVKPVTASLSGMKYEAEELFEYLGANCGRLIMVDTESICEQCGSSRVMNIALLGAAAASGAAGITAEELENAIISRLPEKFHKLNLEALRAGAKGAET